LREDERDAELSDIPPDLIELGPTRATDREKVESWRLHVLIEAGYPLPLAERLAGSDADLHLAVDLVTAGCAPKTAAEILI
jgi:hypothetical protein